MDYHPAVKKILNLLKENQCWFETFEHEPVKTSEEASKVRPGYNITHGAKSLIIKAYNNKTDGKFVMLIMPANCKLDSKKATNVLGVGYSRFANGEEINEITGGILPGAIPPFGNLFGLSVYVDKSLFSNEKIVFNAGDRRFSVAILSSDYKKLVKPILAVLT